MIQIFVEECGEIFGKQLLNDSRRNKDVYCKPNGNAQISQLLGRIDQRSGQCLVPEQMVNMVLFVVNQLDTHRFIGEPPSSNNNAVEQIVQ